MPKKNRSTDAPTSRACDSPSVDRRRFLESVALGSGAAGLFAGLNGVAMAQSPSPLPADSGREGPDPQAGRSQPPPLKDLEGRTAYITAASDGIGLGIARACSNAGMRVVLGYRNAERVQRALALFKPGNAGVLAVKHDVTDRHGWRRLLREIRARFGNLHLLVNNAGIKTLDRASDARADEWDRAVAVNFTAIYNGVSACLPHMLDHGEGAHIVTTASIGGLLPGARAGIYTATKMAAVGLMEALRIELESTTVGTSVFCPGIVRTDNDPRGSRPAPPPAAPGRPAFRFEGMDPLEAGERVLNGVIHNDLFIVSHAEFKAGMQERAAAMLASVPDEPVPPGRLDAQRMVLRAGIYPREIAHRQERRASYRV
jgi:NAD(P)-dependent dehydrogenase (short-subunit alcohol dehydrogenase family)